MGIGQYEDKGTSRAKNPLCSNYCLIEVLWGNRMLTLMCLLNQTAEMPGFYGSGEYDVAGFAVGAVKKDELIEGTNIAKGDVLLGLSSTGVHSNGFSLVRKVLEVG